MLLSKQEREKRDRPDVRDGEASDEEEVYEMEVEELLDELQEVV